MKMTVDSLEFSFPKSFQVIKYDDEIESFKQLSSTMQFRCECEKCPSHKCQKDICDKYSDCTRKREYEGLKGIDLIAIDNNSEILYLIESKDYRKTTSPSVDHIVNEVAKKYRDTLFGIWCGSICERDVKNRNILHLARTKPYGIKFIFHFESPNVPYSSGLFRSVQSDSNKKLVPLKNMERRLREKLQMMKDYVEVCDIDSKSVHKYPWSVSGR